MDTRIPQHARAKRRLVCDYLDAARYCADDGEGCASSRRIDAEEGPIVAKFAKLR